MWWRRRQKGTSPKFGSPMPAISHFEPLIWSSAANSLLLARCTLQYSTSVRYYCYAPFYEKPGQAMYWCNGGGVMESKPAPPAGISFQHAAPKNALTKNSFRKCADFLKHQKKREKLFIICQLAANFSLIREHNKFISFSIY